MVMVHKNLPHKNCVSHCKVQSQRQLLLAYYLFKIIFINHSQPPAVHQFTNYSYVSVTVYLAAVLNRVNTAHVACHFRRVLDCYCCLTKFKYGCRIFVVWRLFSGYQIVKHTVRKILDFQG